MTYVADRYAQALYDCGCDEDAFWDAVQCILESAPLWEALRSPVVHPSEKEAVLRALPPCADTPILLHFLILLVENRRFSLLPDIVESFRLISLQSAQVAECSMTCVHVPEPEQQERLRAALCKLHNKPEVRLIFEIDPTLIGGFILTLDGVTYDQSIRGKLRGLSRYLEEVSAI